MKLLVTRQLTPRVESRLDEEFDATFLNAPDPLDEDQLCDAVRAYDAVLVTLGDRVTARVFDGDLRARIVANFGVGYNHIDTNAAAARGVVVTNTPGAVTDATADIAMTLLLMSARRAGEGERFLRAGKWRGWEPTQLLGQHVSGKTVGIIGLGRIGEAIARRCHFGFGMQVLFYNRSEKTPDFAARQVDMDTLLRSSDFIVVAVPATPQTHHMMGAREFGSMQPHAHFVNIARGDIVDEGALVDALRSGRIAGAGLDVYEHEPHVPDVLRGMDNVTLLPHLGTAALEVRDMMGMVALDNLLAFRDGKTPPNKV